MFKKLIFISLTLLFALQTVTVVMDDYQPHQIDSEHIVYDHDNESVDHQNDCNHCCHCHGTAQLSHSFNIIFVLTLSTEKSFEYQLNVYSLSQTPSLPPPIA